MTITATIVADSVSPMGHRLTTFQLRYPRFIHAEVMTHRVFSRNASSSRAIPVAKMIEDLRRDPAMPVFWGANKPGMQAGAELEMHDLLGVKCVWISAMEDAIAHVETLMKAGLHKQIANRILEPWAHINVVVTSSSFENFYALRRHADAQPEIKVLADAMWQAQQDSTPTLLQPGEWHLPYLTENEQLHPDAIKVSVARCARVSYLTHDGRQTTLEEDIALYNRLVGQMPLHASPAEHQATPDQYEARDAMMSRNSGRLAPQSNWKGEYAWEPEWESPQFHGNFVGWKQLRKMLPGEFTPG